MIINDLDGYYIVFDTKNWNTELDTLAINLFHKNMPRYSVDIDLTYIPIQDRKTSLDTINEHLVELKIMIERSIPGIHIVHKI